MTTETAGLTSDDADVIAQRIFQRAASYQELLFGLAIEQAVLQSPEIQALRKDAERYRWATTYEDNADELVAAVVSCGGDQSAINERVDAAIRALPPKQ